MKVVLLRVAVNGEEYAYESYDMSLDSAESELMAVQNAIADNSGVVTRSWAVLSGVVGVYLSE